MSEDQEFLRELQKEFLDELQFLLEACEESYLKIENPEIRVEELAKIFRLAHSIKGAGAAVGFTDLAAFAHVVEDCLAILRAQPALVDADTVSILLRTGDAIKERIQALRAEVPIPWDVSALKQDLISFTALLLKRGGAQLVATQGAVLSPHRAGVPHEDPPAPPDQGELESHLPSPHTQSAMIKVDSHRVEAILEVVGELVVIKSQLLNEAYKLTGQSRLSSVAALLDKTIRDLQERTLGMQLTPLKSLFLKCQRVARDISTRLKKPIDFMVDGENIELDRNVVEQLSDPLMHIIRNSVDHGIEDAQTRQKVGKPEKGAIRLLAQQAGGRVILRVSDDGAGIDREKVLQKAKETGLVPESVDTSHLEDSEVFEFLFAPGFSTAAIVTDISGRGVGMNVVRENIESLKGRIDVESTPGKGSCFKISIPLATAITEGMLVRVDGQTYILPMDGIRELVDLRNSGVIHMHASGPLLNFRGQFFPLLRLSERLRNSYEPGGPLGAFSKEIVVVYEYEQGLVALEVDRVVGQTQVVMKPLGKGVEPSEGIAGAAILGDGKVALLLDIDSMVQAQGLPVATPNLRA